MGSKFQKAAPVSAKVDTTVQSAYAAPPAARRARLRRIFGDRVIGFWSSPSDTSRFFFIRRAGGCLEPPDPARPRDRAAATASSRTPP